MKIAYFGFDLFYDCLDMLIQNGHDIMKIFTCDVDGEYEHNSKIYAAAERYGIAITNQKPENQMLHILKNEGCDLMISAGYYYKIPVIDGVMQVNIHPSLLPIGRGPWPEPIVILKNLQTGVTIHKLSDSLDSGDILIQGRIETDNSENLKTLTKKSVSLAVHLLSEFVQNIKYYWGHSVPQNGGEYWREPTDSDMTFDITDSFEKIDQITRAFFGYRCLMIKDGAVTVIKEAKCIKNDDDLHVLPEMCIDIDGGRLIILKLA